MTFDLCVGIDYSGAQTSDSPLLALQIYAAEAGNLPRKVTTPAAATGPRRNWSRKEIAEWLVSLARNDRCFIAGIDHCFSFPLAYFDRYGLADWPAFLDDFTRHWPTDAPHMYVDFIRDGKWPRERSRPASTRLGSANEFRLVERRSSSAKSVFQFDVQGSVAKASFCGIPWLRSIRERTARSVHFWPFDGWTVPAGKSVVAEVYPSIFRRRWPMESRSADEHDAYSVARWLAETDRNGLLPRYFDPPLTGDERTIASREGWILGVA